MEWRDGVPLYPEEAEIDDIASSKIDWLIDIDDISFSSGRGTNTFEEDDMSVSTIGSKSFFGGRAISFQDEQLDQVSTVSHLETPGGACSTTSACILDYNNNAINATAQDSQSVGGHGMPPALI